MDIRIVDGRLTKDAEVKVNQSNGKQFLTFTLANNGFSKGTQTTTFFNVVSYNKHDVDNLANFKKGKLVVVSGRPNEVMTIKGSNTYLNRNIIAYNIEGGTYSVSKENGTQVTTYKDVAPNVTCEVPQVQAPTVAATSPKVAEYSAVVNQSEPQAQVHQPQAQPAYAAPTYQAQIFTDNVNTDDDLPF